MAYIGNLNLLKMFKELEIANFNEEFIDSLGALLDDKLSPRVQEFIDGILIESELPNHTDNAFIKRIVDNVQMMQDRLGPIIASKTFHLEARERGIIKTLSSLNIVSIQTDVHEDREVLMTDITWLLDNQDKWQADIKPRTKEAFELFMYEIKQLKVRTNSMYAGYVVKGFTDFERNEYILESIKENKAIFFQREQSRNTGMARIIRERSEIEKLHHWLVYNKLCDENRIGTTLRYLISGGTRR